MTPLPTPDEIATRHTFDPAPGTVHVRDLIAMAKDGIYVKDRVSDHVIGMLVLGKSVGVVTTWEGTLFQLPFVKSMKIRSGNEHLGHAFTDPDGDVLILGGRTLHGSSDVGIQLSAFTADTLKGHAQYSTWLTNTLYAGRAADATTYIRVRNNNKLKDCDDYINSVPYTPGPMSVPPAPGHPPGSGSAATSAKKKKAPTSKKTAAPAATAGPSTPTPAGKKHTTPENSATEPWVMNKATAKAWKAMKSRDEGYKAMVTLAVTKNGEGKGTADDSPSETKTSPLSDPPTSEGEGGAHPQYGGKGPLSFADYMADPSQLTLAGDAGEESAAYESAADEPAGEGPAGEEFAVEEPLPAANGEGGDDGDDGDDGDYDPTPTKKHKTGKSGGRKRGGKKGRGGRE
jgi:hypothetical protein